MSSMFEKMYDEMELEEVICRLPSELAIGSLKRRLQTLDDLKKFLCMPDAGGASKVKEVQDHVNWLIMHNSIEDLFDTFEQAYHPNLFGWLSKENKKEIVAKGRSHFTIEFLFNLTSPDDHEQLNYILDQVLQSNDIPKISSVLRKVDTEYFQDMLQKVLTNDKPEIKSLVLSIANGANDKTISEHQKMIGLKAFAKLPESFAGAGHINTVDFKLFKHLKPLERIMALDRYLNYFPTYRKVKVFNPEPSEDDFNMILFAGCFQFNDLVEKIKNKYDKITKLEKSKEDDEP